MRHWLQDISDIACQLYEQAQQRQRLLFLSEALALREDLALLRCCDHCRTAFDARWPVHKISGAGFDMWRN